MKKEISEKIVKLKDETVERGKHILERINPIPRLKRKKVEQTELIENNPETEVREENKDKKKGKVLGIFAKIIGIIALVLVVTLVVFGVGIYGFNWSDKVTETVKNIIPYPAADINITNLVKMSDFDKEVNFVKDLYTNEVTEDQKIDFNSESGKEKLAEFKKTILDNLIENQVILILASKNKITVTTDEIDQMYSQYEQIYGQEKLAQIPKAREKVKIQVLRQKLEDKVILQVHARHILIASVETDDQLTKDAAKAKAQSILDQIKTGASFEELAKISSDDTGSKESGGDLGFFSRGKMVKEFEDAAFALKNGEISEVIQTEFGYHIIKVEERRGEIDKDFASWLEEEKGKAIVWRFVAK